MKKKVMLVSLLCLMGTHTLQPVTPVLLQSLNPSSTRLYNSTFEALKLLDPHISTIYESETDKELLNQELRKPIRVPYTDPSLSMLVPIYNVLEKHPNMNKDQIIQALKTVNANPGIDYKSDQAGGKSLSKKQEETLRLFFRDMDTDHFDKKVTSAIGQYLRQKDLRPLPTTQVLKLFKTGTNSYMPFAQQFYISIAPFITDAKVTNLELGGKNIETLIGMPLDMSNLQKLLLGRNALKSLEGMPPKLPNLQLFNLDLNGLRSLGGMSQKLPNLVFLGLMRNALRSLEGMPPKLPNLRRLVLSKNALRSLGGLPSELPKLKEMPIDHNPWSDNATIEAQTENTLDALGKRGVDFSPLF